MGLVEGNLTGSIFNVYETSYKKLHHNMVATIEYYRDIDHNLPRRVRIYYRRDNTGFALGTEYNNLK